MASPSPKLLHLAAGLLGAKAEEARWYLLAGDGSDRLFWRVTTGRESLVAVDGSGLSRERWAENAALAQIGAHLRAAGLPVPEILAQAAHEGLFLIENLGSDHLADAARRSDEPGRERLYSQAVDLLIQMQLKATPGFNTDWCSQTERYDAPMVRRFEQDYFLNAFARDFLGLAQPGQGLAGELDSLAAAAAGAGQPVFLHRDFQSRNIMLRQGRLRLIDFQSARLGPPGYDLASLLIDPYVGLEKSLRSLLRTRYVSLAAKAGLVEPEEFETHYQILALHRNLQMLGAFGHLSKAKGRLKFLDYIPAAQTGLKKRIAGPIFDPWPGLRRLILGLPGPEDKIAEVKHGR